MGDAGGGGIRFAVQGKFGVDGTEIREEIGKFFGSVVFNVAIPRNVRLAEAPSYGMPIYLYDKNCSGSVAYLKLVEEFFARKNVKYKKITKGKV